MFSFVLFRSFEPDLYAAARLDPQILPDKPSALASATWLGKWGLRVAQKATS